MKEMQNTLSHWISSKLEVIIGKEEILTPRKLDILSMELSITLKEVEGLKPLSENTCRESIVAYALKEYSTEIFGVVSTYKGPSEISDKCIRRMKSQRKKGFDGLNIIRESNVRLRK